MAQQQNRKMQGDAAQNKGQGPLLVATVGLPARGKSLLARRLSRYFNYKGQLTKVFDISEYRRKHYDRYDSHLIFDPSNTAAKELRHKSFREALLDAIDFLKENPEDSLALLDGPNVCADQRDLIVQEARSSCVRVCFLECLCQNNELLKKHLQSILEYSHDYRSMSFETALEDLQCKMQHYERQYDNFELKSGVPLIRIINNAQDGVMARGVHGKETDLLAYVAEPKKSQQVLYFSRHGESEYNVLGRIGGNSDLSPRGRKYAKMLCNHLKTLNLEDLQIWTSTLQRTKTTVEHMNVPKMHRHELDELHSGLCESYSYEELLEEYPKEMAARDADKLRYRYPQGESYLDIMTRLMPVLRQLEIETNVLVVSHQAVLRCVLAYFLGTPIDDIPYMKVPLHTLIKLTLEGHSYKMESVTMPVECVDTNRVKPTNCSIDRKKEDVLMTIPKHFDSLAHV